MNRKSFKLITLLLILFITTEIHFLFGNAISTDKTKNEIFTALDSNHQIHHQYHCAWTYDVHNRLTRIEEGDSSKNIKKSSFFYNELGYLEKVTKPDGITLHYQYYSPCHDSSPQLQRLFSSDHSIDYQIEYDADNRPILLIDHVHGLNLSRSYNESCAITHETSGVGISVINEYDCYGRRIGMTFPDNSRVAYHYEDALLTSIERIQPHRNLIYTHTYCYDEHGQIISNILPGHLGELDFHYDEIGKIETINSPYWSEKLARTNEHVPHCITQCTIQDAGGISSSEYIYAEDEQLVCEKGEFHHRYAYDTLFNRIAVNEDEWHVNAINQITHTSNSSFVYDKNGNLIQKQQDSTHYQYEYDALNRLTKVIKDHELACEYGYDYFDRRLVEKVFKWNKLDNSWELIKTDYFIYDGNQEIGKMDANSCIQELRILGLSRGSESGAAIALEIGEQTFIPIQDHRGSVCCLINLQTKEVEEFYRYSAFGEERIFDALGHILQESVVGNPWRYIAKRKDPISGAVFFGKRHYDPVMGRWLTPDPLFIADTPNIYAFLRNDPINRQDLYGLYSFYNGWEYFINIPHRLFQNVKSHFCLKEKLEGVGEGVLGETMMLLVGGYNHISHAGVFGDGNLHEKVRVTFINGILTTYDTLLTNVQLISKTHGGIKIDYIFRPTEGWTNDIKNAAAIKLGYPFGYRSVFCYELAKMWKGLIQEMGGTEEGGVIVHYAHSLGGSDTDRALDLLTPEEQKMIRVITFGSVTLTRNSGFRNVTHYMSVNDGLRILDPSGLIRNWWSSHGNIIWKEHPKAPSTLPIDHLFGGPTYHSILMELGKQFLIEFDHYR